MSMSRLNLKTSRVFKSSDIQACFTDALNKLKNSDDAFSINAVMETVNACLQDEMERMFLEAMKEWKQGAQIPHTAQSATPPWIQQAAAPVAPGTIPPWAAPESSVPAKKARRRTAAKV